MVQEDNTKVQTANAPTEVKPKNNSDNQSNKNTSKAKEVNNTPKAEKPNTPQAPANPPKAEDSTSNVYTNKNFAFSLTFPASWKDKYTATEVSNRIHVAMKLQNKQFSGEGMLFSILKKGPDLDEAHFDRIDKDKRYLEAKGITYVIGGPTDVPVSADEGPVLQLYIKMSRDCASVVKTLKAI